MKPGWADDSRLEYAGRPFKQATKKEAERKRAIGGRRGGRSRKVDRILAELPIDDGPQDLNDCYDFEVEP